MLDFDVIPTKLLWLDLEMTGLDANKDVIIEVAAVVTDFDFKSLGSYEAVIKQSEEKLTSMNEWAATQHAASGLTERVRAEGRAEAEIEQELASFIAEQFGGEPAVLAGNSIHNDRIFIKQYWPGVEARLHYRMCDVSSLKVLMQGKYQVVLEKNNSHRANDDIQASINELQYYLDWFKKSGSQDS